MSLATLHITCSAPTMSFVCEISGESLSTLAVSTNDAIVVTPSGHLCRRSLLLAKLAENGGLDPFETIAFNGSSSRPLREEDLVEVQQLRPSKSLDAPLVVPPRPQSGSISHTLQQLQQDYDAVVLELFDTRKLLTETRQELALALYENDAAVRVVARLAAERDQAWSAVHTLKSTATQDAPPAITTAPPESQSNNGQHPEQESDEPPAKKSKTSIDSTPTKLPEEDWNLMVSAWEKLHENRKARQKAASKRAVSLEQLTTLVAMALPTPPPSTSTHPVLAETTGSKTALASSGWGAEAATSDPCLVHSCQQYPHVLVYRPVTGSTSTATWSLQTMNASSTAMVGSALDVRDAKAAVASINGSVDIVLVGATDASNGTNLPLISAKEAATTVIVDVRLHPDGVHVVAATSRGMVLVGRIDTARVVACFGHSIKESGASYSTGVLHPDGLIYIVAHAVTGDLLLWDFKSQSLADTILSSGLSSPVTSVDCSNTGYHIAAAYQSGAVLVWDLRKQQVLATINQQQGTKDGDLLDAVVSVKFDDSGKFLAYSGNRRDGGGLGIGIVTVKEWNKTTMLTAPSFSATAGLIWGPTWIAAAASSKDESGPRVLVFGLPST
jgi:pre-mRNA-processing factor 19